MRAYIGLGSNLGDRVAHLRAALEGLSNIDGTNVRRVSSLYETDPVGAADLPFLNAVVELDTSLEPHALLVSLLDIERERQRTREVRWENRTLDLDLLCAYTPINETDRAIPEGPMGQPIVRSERPGEVPALQLPHPRMGSRDFVLGPLAELEPALPIGTQTCAQLLEALNATVRTIRRVIRPWPARDPGLD